MDLYFVMIINQSIKRAEISNMKHFDYKPGREQ